MTGAELRLGRYDLAVRGGTLVRPTGRVVADLGIRDGRIAGIVAPGTPLDAAEEFDAKGHAILPGVVDIHTHHRDPGFTAKGDITTETAAGAAGGVTTSLGMPNVSPPPNTPERLAAMLDLYARKSLVDYNVNASAAVPSEIPALAKQGIAAFKIFMVEDTGRDYPHMPGTGVHDHGKLLEIFEAVAETGLRLMVHPHDQALMTRIEHEFWDRGERDARAYARAYAAYDGLIWDSAAALLIRLHRATGAPLHLLHTQSRGVLRLLREAKADGLAVTAELNPWALFLGNDWANIERLGSYALSYWVPAVNTEPLWEALNDGTIDLVSTDHAPHLREEKEPGWTDGWKAHTGTPAIQFYLSMLLDAAHRGRITLERVAEVTSSAPARALGLGTKGRLEVGADADLAIVDLDAELEVRDEIVISRIGWTPYAGQTYRGLVTQTFVRGHLVYDRGSVVGEPGWGRQVTPTDPPATPGPAAARHTAAGGARPAEARAAALDSKELSVP